MTLTEIKRQPGVSDLSSKTKTSFAAALHFENKGDHVKAETYLEKALKQEEEGI